MPSVSTERASLKQRVDRLYREYLTDKQSPDYTYYVKSTNRVDKWWADSCVSKLRKIVSIRTRIRDIEQCINIVTGDPNVLADTVREKRYEEILSDMSNYYSRFVSVESYKYILTTMD